MRPRISLALNPGYTLRQAIASISPHLAAALREHAET
jgi:hypothetical protein